MNIPRVVVATRPTALQRVIERHGTAGQARFFIASRGQSLEYQQSWDTEQQSALTLVDGIIPLDWLRN